MNELLTAWGLEGGECTALASGLINQTWRVEVGGERYILQSLNTTIFDPVLHEDIEAVTRHLERAGVPTPTLVRTSKGSLWHEFDGGCWRLMTVVGDRTVESMADPADAEAAGALIGRFHNATADLDWAFRNPRSQGGFHDTSRRLAHLQQVVESGRDDPFYEPVAALAARLQTHKALCQEVEGLPARVVHGDLKISNIRFLGHEAHALIDLDTLARGTLDAELGDAFRSWCNRAAEGQPPQFDLALFEAGVRGYASEARQVTAAEQQSLVTCFSCMLWRLIRHHGKELLLRDFSRSNGRIGS